MSAAIDAAAMPQRPALVVADAAHVPLPRSGPASVASTSSMASSASAEARLKEAAANAIMRAKMEAALAAKAVAWQAEQARNGITVTTAQAVAHVNKTPADKA